MGPENIFWISTSYHFFPMIVLDISNTTYHFRAQFLSSSTDLKQSITYRYQSSTKRREASDHIIHNLDKII